MSDEKPDNAKEEAPKDDKFTLSDDEPRYIPKIDAKTANTTNGTMYGVQADTVTGGVTTNVFASTAEVDLEFCQMTADQLAEANEQFIDPGGFGDATHHLRTDHIVVLCGIGTGRSLAGHRLLIDRVATRIVDVNRARRLSSLREGELKDGTGYLWDLSGSTERPFTDQDFKQCATLLKAHNCWLVIVLDHASQSPESAVKRTVTLTAPIPVEVALSALRHRHPEADRAASDMIKNEFALALDDASPDKAVHAADIAVRVIAKDLTQQEAVSALREEVATSVARRLGPLDNRELILSFAAAALQHEPYEEVIQHAVDLDEEIRKARLPEKKKDKLHKRCVLDRSVAGMLRNIGATTVVHDHPRHKGLKKETISFERQDWATAVLCHVWAQFPAARTVLREWMCGDAMASRFHDASVRALCTIVTRVPANEPLQIVKELGSARRYSHRSIAASTLVQLADDTQLHPHVMRIFQAWIKNGSAYQQWTVAQVYSSSYGRRDLPDALAKLTQIGKSHLVTPQNAVVAGVVRMLKDESIRTTVIDTVVSWTEPRYRRTGLRSVSLSLGLWVSGFFSRPNTYFATFGNHFPRQVRELFKQVLSDQDFGLIVIEHLAELAQHARWADEKKSAELLRLTRLITPDLRWRQRRHAVEALCFQHPTKRTTILRIFRTARKAELKQRSPRTVDPNATAADGSARQQVRQLRFAFSEAFTVITDRFRNKAS